MKTTTMAHILSNITKDYPTLGYKLKEQSEITHFKNTFLTPIQREQLLFITLKNNTLLFAFKHKALCVEFNHYKHKQIIESLKQHKEHFPILSAIQKIHAYVPSHILCPPPKPQHLLAFYEHSDGSFKNLAQNEQIHKKIEALRLSIKRRWEAQNGK